MSKPDRRLNAWREDLADRRLEGVAEAMRFENGIPHRVAAPDLPLRTAPRPGAAQDTALLCGEKVLVFERKDGWAWVQSVADNYVGYCDANGLTEDLTAPTHRVATLQTLVFPEPDIKIPPLAHLSFGSGVTVPGNTGKFAEIAFPGGRSGFAPARHLKPVDSVEDDAVAVAEQFLGAPYLWGGKTAAGIDCSGLVQLVYTACGIPCPRDTDMQEANFGDPVAFDGDLSVLRRGDCVFWPGHVGIWIDPNRFIHANAGFMKTVIEPLSEAIARIAAEPGLTVSSVRRPPPGNA